MNIAGTVVELLSQRPAAGYTVLVVGYTHRRVRIHIEGGKPPWRWVTLTNSTDVISLKTNAEGRFSADPKTPEAPPSNGQEGEKPAYHSASVTVKSASGAILAHQEKSSTGTAFSFPLSVPFHLESGHLAISGHVTEKWTGNAAANYSVRVVGFSKRTFSRPPQKVGEKPEVVTNKGETSSITLTADAGGHFFTEPLAPPIPEPPAGFHPVGPTTYGASVTVSSNNIDLAAATKDVATEVVDFAMEVPGWISEGPGNVTGVIMSIAVHPTNPNIVYAGAQYGGVWKTTDGGATWKPTMDSESNLYVGAVGLCAAQPDVVYAAMNSSAEFWSSPGVFRSSDGGTTWQRGGNLSSDSPASHKIHNLQIAVHPTNPDIVYVAADRALHRSNDGGATWLVHPISIDGGTPTKNRYGIFDGNVQDVKLDPDHPDMVFIAVKGGGIYSSTNGGLNWSTLGADFRFPVRYPQKKKDLTKTVGFDSPYRSVLGLGGPAESRRLVVKVHGTILVSDDAGQNWRSLPGMSHGYEHDDPRWDSCIAVDPNNPDVIVAGGQSLSATLDGGQSWRPLERLHQDEQTITFCSDGSFYFGNDGCVGRATPSFVPLPGFTVRKVSDGLVGTHCRPRHLDVSRTATLVVGTSTYDTGILRSGRDHFAIWEKIAGPEGGLFAIDPTDENKMFCAPWGSKEFLLVSTNGGSKFNKKKLTFRDAAGHTDAHPVALGIRPDDSRRLYAGAFYGWLYYSLDGGDHWDHVKDGNGDPLLVAGGSAKGDRAISFGFAPSNGAVLYVGTTNGRLWRTTSGATTSEGWEDLGRPSAETDALAAIAVHPDDSNEVFVGYPRLGTNRVWQGKQQTDGSFAWTNASAGLPTNSSVEALVIDPHHPAHVFAATTRGVYATADAGATWHPLVGGLPNVPAVGLRFRDRDRKLWASTYCRGVFSCQLA